MGKIVQNNFSGGVLSPSLYGRSDLQSYYKGCAKAENFIVTKEGSLRKRRGISSIWKYDRSQYTGIRIFPYHYDRTESGIIVLLIQSDSQSAGRIQIVLLDKNGVQKDSATLADGTFTQADLDSLQLKQIGDELWFTGAGIFQVVRVNDYMTSSVKLQNLSWAPAGKPAPLKSFTVRGYNAAGSQYDGSGETSYYYCAYIVVDGVSSSQLEKVGYQKKSWVAGDYTQCIVEITQAQLDAGFDYVVIGKSNGGKGTYGEVCRFYMEDFEGNLKLTFTDKNVSPGEGVFEQTNILGNGFENPLCVDCFQQRKVFANATTDGKKFPMTMWYSEAGNLDNFYANRPAVDSDAFSPTISTTGPSFIRWIVSYHEMLVLFTEAGLFSVGFSQQAGFSASSCRISRFSNISISSTVAPVVTDAGVVFVGGDNKTVYTAAYDLQENMMKPINRLVLAAHLTRKSQIKAMALQSAPDNVVWVVTDDGRYLTFTFERNEEVYAWSDGFIRDAEIKDAISLGSVTDSSADRTYADMIYLVKKGEELYICRQIDGCSDKIGDVETPVTATLTTLRPESQERTISGLQKNIKDVLLRLYETGGVSVVPVVGSGPFQLVPAKMSGAELFTGDVKVMPRGYINEAGQMTYVSDNDKPCEILQVVTQLEVNG
ncbi:MAG: hypothetical protein J6N18_02075 [Kiritimatiellae bacterium]|nr:hypothetical protein [Kiritimatiellia bacterium]